MVHTRKRLDEIMQTPTYDPRWRFRNAVSDREIEQIARMCQDDPVFQKANPKLTLQERIGIYKNWFKWCPASFLMLLEYADEDHIVAISIALPLTAKGAARLWNAEVDCLKLVERDLSRAIEQTKSVLLDTLFVAPQYRRRHKGYAFAMVFKHVAKFIDDTTLPVELLVKPDAHSIKNLLHQAGFEEHPHGKELYRLSIGRPLSEWGGTMHKEAAVAEKIMDHISICSRLENTLQDDILSILKMNREPIPADDLVTRMKTQKPNLRTAQVRTALFPLMSTHQIEISEDRKIRLLDAHRSDK